MKLFAILLTTSVLGMVAIGYCYTETRKADQSSMLMNCQYEVVYNMEFL